MTSDRTAALFAFLRDQGWGEADVAPLAGDASNRRYLRLSAAGRRAVLMDAPPERGEDVRPFAAVTRWLRDAGYSAPEILGADHDRGFLLLEDLGDALFSRHIAERPEAELPLYERAVDLLADIARRPAPGHMGTAPLSMPIAPYDMAVLEREALLIVDWWLPAVTGGPPASGLRVDFTGLLAAAMTGVAAAREVVVLRDYHADNLLWLPDRSGLAAVGLLDYQDALLGHPAYDLVSLLEDARRDTTADLREAMLTRYLAARPDLDAGGFRAAYAALGAQRNLKIVGIFTRLAVRDGKPGYLGMIPRVWAHLMNDLAHPALADLCAWVADNVPEPTEERLRSIAAEASG